MAGPSPIEWTDRTWNPVRGCTRVSPGCGGPGPHGGCYAERVAVRFSKPGLPYEGLAEVRGGRARWTGKLSFGHDLEAPLRWRTPSRIFVNSMSDLFHEAVPNAEIDRIFAIMALCPQHTFQVLTKRSARMRAYLAAARAHPVGLAAMDITLHEMARNPRSEVGRCCTLQGDICHLKVWPLPNVWLGVSAEDQLRADERIPDLLATPAAVRFVSAEPLLGRIDFTRIRCPNLCSSPDNCNRCYPDGGSATGTFDAIADGGIGLFIVGGESGPRARPMHVDWVREIRDPCAAVKVPFFFKQWGEWVPEMLAARECWPADRWHEWPAEASHLGLPAAAVRVGRAKAGRLLDGAEHNGLPEAGRG